MGAGPFPYPHPPKKKKNHIHKHIRIYTYTYTYMSMWETLPQIYTPLTRVYLSLLLRGGGFPSLYPHYYLPSNCAKKMGGGFSLPSSLPFLSPFLYLYVNYITPIWTNVYPSYPCLFILLSWGREEEFSFLYPHYYPPSNCAKRGKKRGGGHHITFILAEVEFGRKKQHKKPTSSCTVLFFTV